MDENQNQNPGNQIEDNITEQLSGNAAMEVNQQTTQSEPDNRDQIAQVSQNTTLNILKYHF